MKSVKRENFFLIIWFCCTMILVGVCNLGFIRGTMAGFGNMSGQLTAAYVIEYSSNYPSELGISNELKREAIVSQNYIIKDNQFVLDGYEFIEWNTLVDGSGDTYKPNDSITLEKNITLYAQWKKIEVINISYGDVNINGQIDEEDYLLIEASINNGNNLTGQALLNADVNSDGIVDLVDADIIKQAYLGTDGYNDCLPSKPILKYEIYVGESDGEDSGDGEGNTSGDNNVNNPSGDEDKEASDNNSDDEADNSDGNIDSSVSGSNSGTGNSGSGNASSGIGSSGNTSSGGGSSGTGSNKPSSSTSSSDGGNQSGYSSEGEDKKEEETINNNDEDNNENEISETDKKDEKPVSVNNNSDSTDSGNKSYVWIIVVVMCLVSLRLIVYVVEKFKEKENDNKL